MSNPSHMLSHLQYSVHPHKPLSPDQDTHPDPPFQYSSSQSTFYPQDATFASPNVHPDSDPQLPSAYVSQSPSPVDAHPPASALSHPITAPPSQERFLHSDVTPFSAEDRIPTQTDPGSEREPLEPTFDKYSTGNVNSSLLDQRRMSEPAALSVPSLYPSGPSLGSRYQPLDIPYSGSSFHQSKPYLTPLQRGISTGSLRDLRHHHIQYPPHPSEWKHNNSLPEHSDLYDQSDNLDEPVSPMQPNFTGGLVGSPTLGVPYSPLSDSFYGPSPPGTGTSTSSAPISTGIANGSPHSSSQHFHRSLSSSNVSGDAADRKTYSFVALPGNAVKKRPRRRYDEIERLYQCNWPDCSKSYGTLNHLNAHVTMQKHGQKRSPSEFKDLRKQWRKAKKESEAAAVALRRQSFEAYDDHSGFDHRYLSSQGIHQRQHTVHHPGLGLSSSVSVAQPGSTERFPVAIDDIRFPSYDRTDTLSNFTSYPARQRYSGSLPASWQDGPNAPSRQSYMPSSHTPHHSQLPQLSINNSRPSEPFNRLPQNSTLLTPLPGYHSDVPSMMNAMLPGDSTNYGNAEAFDAHDTDSNSRPGTGHASIGHHSGDEYQHAPH